MLNEFYVERDCRLINVVDWVESGKWRMTGDRLRVSSVRYVSTGGGLNAVVFDRTGLYAFTKSVYSGITDASRGRVGRLFASLRGSRVHGGVLEWDRFQAGGVVKVDMGGSV